MLTKITAISNLNADVVFLSDIRLGTKIKKFTDAVRLNYKVFSNSTSSKRGVCILIKNNIDLTVVNTYKDGNENIILLHCLLNKNDIILGAVYGPNTNNDSFFTDLDRGLSNLPRIPTILGGDWNATNCLDPVPNNLDCFSMAEIPSLHRSRELDILKNNYELVDPYRLLNPRATDYTYEPHGTVRKNRSRIDFFLVSGPMSDAVKSCFISAGYCKNSSTTDPSY